MAFSGQHQYHNYLGEHSSDGNATAFIVAIGWDNAGSPYQGMTYYNTTTNQLMYWDGNAAAWAPVAGAGAGDVVGPSGSLGNEVVRFDSTTGKLITGSLNQVDTVIYNNNGALTASFLVARSGSQFGELTTDVHQFTGSISISGSTGIVTFDGSPIAHSALTGLTGSDDHTQYLLVDGTRGMSANLGVTGSINVGGTVGITGSLFVAGTDISSSINSHVTNTSNPHTVTAAQVGNSVAQWNANQLQGNAVTGAAPVDGNLLYWNNGSATWDLVASSSLTGIDHGGLAGLNDDDHTQYHNNGRGDARYYRQDQLTSSLSGSTGASLVGTDTKAYLNNAVTVEVALDHLNTQNVRHFTSSVGNPNGWCVGATGDVYVDETYKISYINIGGTTGSWYVK